MAITKNMIHRKDWEFCNTDDIGPLEYVNDYHNGGGILSFKYIIGTDTLVVSSKGIYSPYCYQLHSGGRKINTLVFFINLMLMVKHTIVLKMML